MVARSNSSCSPRIVLGFALAWWIPAGVFAVGCQGQDTALAPDHLFQQQIRPLLVQYCRECHSGDGAEAEIDFAAVDSLDDVQTQPAIWQKVRTVLAEHQMPPPEAIPLPEADQTRLLTWVRNWLRKEAQTRSGDPGPIILRRLSNAEYDYTIEELTSVPSWSPTSEFPVDGAAGEGFTNTGSSQGMSPALVTKYLDAAKAIAQHAVLLPDGIRFSAFDTRRDQTDEILKNIQAFYHRFTSDSGGTAVDLQGIQFATNQGGRLPVDRYLQATMAYRQDSQQASKTIEEFALERGLSAKYLSLLWRMLHDDAMGEDSIFLRQIRSDWQRASADQVPELVATIQAMQRMMWTFQPVGQIGRMGGPQAWLEPQSPFVSRQELKLAFGADDGEDPTICLIAAVPVDDASGALIQWQRTRLEFADGRPPILLKDVAGIVKKVQATVATDVHRTAEYLDAIASLRASQAPAGRLASNRDLDPLRLTAWTDYLDVGPLALAMEGHLREPLSRINNNPEINGWGSPNTPSLLTNRSTETVSFSTLVLPPRSVFVHPSPELDSVVVWKSPLQGRVQIQGLVADADANCGNGVLWSMQHQNESGRNSIGSGSIGNGSQADIGATVEVDVRVGDLISLVIQPGNRDHTCDTTRVDLTIRELDGDRRTWNLTEDIVDRVQDGNPAADRQGNQETWHFCAHAAIASTADSIPAGSSLAAWRTALLTSASDSDLQRLADAVTACLETPAPESLEAADQQLREQLLAWNGPLQWLVSIEPDSSVAGAEFGLDPSRFGVAPGGATVAADSLCVTAPQTLEVRLPRSLVRGAVLVTEGTLSNPGPRPENSPPPCAQLQLGFRNAGQPALDWSLPILTGAESERGPLDAAAAAFRDVFPPAVCYSRIVPVDEVVTLTLYHREDQHLQRLLLNDAEQAQLNQMWRELYFVSQEPLLLVNVLDQITEFATQDRADLVTAFAPMRKPILERADRFRASLLESEPGHLEAVKQFADLAWRRPLVESEKDGLEQLYRQLREASLTHDQAIRMLLARVLTSPAFLFKLERPGNGSQPVAVSDLELATRLSYFLWSSPPDSELRQLAETGRLTAIGAASDPNLQTVLRQQVSRMQQDPRIRRLAIQFACQWLHVRNFDQNNDKNESAFPEFASIRHDMYEETVRFFEDLFRNDGSILDLIAADHTFVNQALADHYGLKEVSGAGWHRVHGMRALGRGGVLGMATILASQSGASRTSPILRGQWVSETLLGERLPRPPANVPQLPDTVPEGLTARQLIEHHSGQPACAKCHLRIDPYGFALEQFDAIGRARAELADTRTVLMDGTPIAGLTEMVDYLATTRQDDVVRQFCRKLLGYALGREVLLSDEPLLDEMQIQLKANQYRFRVALESIVTSPQFLNIRGDGIAAEPEPEPAGSESR